MDVYTHSSNVDVSYQVDHTDEIVIRRTKFWHDMLYDFNYTSFKLSKIYMKFVITKL